MNAGRSRRTEADLRSAGAHTGVCQTDLSGLAGTITGMPTFDVAVAEIDDPVWFAARLGEGLGVPELAALTGYGRWAVRRALAVHGLEDPSPARAAARATTRKKQTALAAARAAAGAARASRAATRVAAARALLDDPVWLRARYETDGLTTTRIAELTRTSGPVVRAALRQHKIVVRRNVSFADAARLARADALLADTGWLRARYETDRMSLPRVAVAASTSVGRVRAAMVAAGVPARPGGIAGTLPAVTVGWLTSRYVADRMTVPEIAGLAGRVPTGALRLLRQHGLVGPDLPVPLLDDPVWLRARYETDRLTPVRVGALAGASVAQVLGALRAHQIGVRPAVRVKPPLLENARWLRARYETDGLTVGQVAVLAGAAQSSVTDAMRRHGIRSRVGARRTRPGGPQTARPGEAVPGNDRGPQPAP